MNALVKEIRLAFGMSQTEFADLLGSKYATVNRWENGHNRPGPKTQERILELCLERGIPVFDIIMKNIKAQINEVQPEPGRILLYHGSKSGLQGEIQPRARKQCDFGSGFYMGTDPMQPLTLICDFENAKFYVVSIEIENLSVMDVPADLNWAFLVAYHRGKMNNIKGTAFYEKYAAMMNGRDVIIGSIANDRMFVVLDDFFKGNITDTALVQSLSALELGRQYVAISEAGCRNVRVEKEIPLTYFEKQVLKMKSDENREMGVSLAEEICRKYRREGHYFDEILEQSREVK